MLTEISLLVKFQFRYTWNLKLHTHMTFPFQMNYIYQMICHEDAFRLFCHIRVKLSCMTLLTYLSEKTFSSTVWGSKGWKIGSC